MKKITVAPFIAWIKQQFIKKKRKKSIAIVIVLLIVIGGIIKVLLPKPKPPISITIEKTERRNITQLVSGSGTVQPETQVKISPEVSGEIIELPIIEGQKVKKGDLLFRINPSTLRETVEQANASLNSAKAQELQAKAKFLQATDNLQRQESLYQQKLLSETDYISAKLNVETNQALYQAAQYDEKRLESSLRQTKLNLVKATVVSPIDGIVTLLNSKLGERVLGTIQMAGTEVVRIADLAQMEVQMDVNENDIVKVHMGDTAKIYVDAFPNQTFKGTIREIADVAQTTSAGSQDQITKFTVTIRILHETNGPKLKTGMSAIVDIQTAHVKNVMSVPIQSVTIRKASIRNLSEFNYKSPDESAEKQEKKKDKMIRVVFVKENNVVRQRLVETGISSNNYIEIKKGLDEKEMIVTGSFKAITKDLQDSSIVILEKDTKDGKKFDKEQTK